MTRKTSQLVQPRLEYLSLIVSALWGLPASELAGIRAIARPEQPD